MMYINLFELVIYSYALGVCAGLCLAAFIVSRYRGKNYANL